MRGHIKDSELFIRLIYAAIAGVSLMFMMIHAEDIGFWYDEFAQICFSGMDQTLLDSLLVTDPTPPLFNVLANIWYDLVPYGERWLLLLPQLAMVCGVYICALWGEILGGKVAGVWAGMLVGFSQMVIEQCGFEFRGYGFYLLFAALAFYLHSRLLKKEVQTSLREDMGFCFALIGLLYSHIFGTLIFTGLGCIDAVLIYKRKLSLKRIFVYIFSGLAFLPWALYFLISTGEQAAQSEVNWMSAPTLWDVIKLIAYLCGNHILVCALLAIGFCVVLGSSYQDIKTKCLLVTTMQRLIPLIIPIFVVSLAFLYGILRARYASLWAKRYFTGLFPCCAVICALGAVQIKVWINQTFKKKQMGRVGLVFLALSIFPMFLIKTATGDTPLGKYYYREVTRVLYAQPDIRDEKRLILSTMDQFIEGWEEYYCCKQGMREGLEIQSIYDVTPEDLRDKEIVYLEYNFWEERSWQSPVRKILEAEYTATQRWDDIRLIRYERQK